MKDDLEKFIGENRELFDDKEPKGKVWSKIKDRVPARRHRFLWLWKAAAVLFFLTSLTLYFRGDLRTKAQLLAQKEKISSDFKDVESFYFELISEKKSLINNFEDEVEIDYGYEQDLQNLDAMYEVLKDELRSNPSKKVVDALMLNLVVRIDILNKKLAELEADDLQQEAWEANDPEI
ncbi:MAG: hypothetical protein MJA30_07955 [Cytophagales bacterium]|nr:hypothetical protein [Cytophagales bacterium]